MFPQALRRHDYVTTYTEELEHVGVLIGHALCGHDVQDVPALVVQLRGHQTALFNQQLHQRRVRLTITHPHIQSTKPPIPCITHNCT